MTASWLAAERLPALLLAAVVLVAPAVPLGFVAAPAYLTFVAAAVLVYLGAGLTEAWRAQRTLDADALIATAVRKATEESDSKLHELLGQLNANTAEIKALQTQMQALQFRAAARS